MGKVHTTRGHLAAFFSILIWGMTYISTKVLLVSFSAVEIIFFRLVLGLIALMVISPPIMRARDLDPGALGRELRFMAAGLFGVTIYFLLQNVALTYTLAANVGVLTSAAPLFTALIAWVFFRDRLKANFFLGFVAAMAGIILITFNGSFVFKVDSFGDLLAVLAAVVWAVYTILVKKIDSEYADMVMSTRKIFTYGFLFMLPIMNVNLFHLGLWRFTVLSNLLNMLFLGLGATAVCFLSWGYAVSVLGPVKTSVYIYMVPLISIASAALMLGEKISMFAALGMLMIMVGMALSEMGKT